MTLSLVNLRLTIERDLFRLGPVWALLVGVVLGGRGEVSSLTAQTLAVLILALILVDVIWGGLWGQMLALARSGRGEDPSSSLVGEETSPLPVPPLPYAQATAPFTRLWLWLRDDREGAGRDAGLGLAALLLATAGLVAIMILVSQAGSPGRDLTAGEAALAASVAVFVLVLLGAILDPAFPAGTQLLAAAIGIAWPWLLGLNLLSWQAPPPYMWLLIAGFTLLAFLETSDRGEVSSPTATLPLLPTLACYGLIVSAPVLAAAPWTTGAVETSTLLSSGLTALVFSVPAWRLLRGRPAGASRWHLLALLVITLSLLAAPP